MASVAVAAALATGLAACGSGDASDDPVASVGEEEVERKDLDERVDQLRRVQASSAAQQARAGGQGDGDYQPVTDKTLEQQALSELLLAAALEQEAVRRGIEVTDEEVRARWDAAAGDQFRNDKELRQFLGGRSVEDVLDQLRLQLLTERIHAQVAKRAGGGKAGTKAVRQFQKDFRRRWSERTECDVPQATSLCDAER